MSADSVRVRRAELADIPALTEFSKERESPVGGPGRNSRAEHRTQLSKRLTDTLDHPDRTVLVAVEAGAVVGMVMVSDDEVGVLVPVPVLTVSNLMVAPRARHRGVGRALLAGVVGIADERGLEHIVSSSAPAGTNRYLARLGFMPLSSRRIAPTAMLRRVLGAAPTPDRVAMLRRARIVRSSRAGFPARALTRGA